MGFSIVKIVVENGTCSHTGTVCSGSVAGTITVGSNNFVYTEGQLDMVEDGTLEVPTHNNPPCIPPNMQSHSFIPNNIQNTFVFIESNLVCVIGDYYTSDTTTIDNQGNNSFVDINI